MIIAIFGRSATGKTTIASIVARQLGTPVRHCGTVLRKAAQEQGFSIDKAPISVHETVDRATQAWCNARANMNVVIEGRFLNWVLAECQDLLLIKLQASSAVRVGRLIARLEREFDEKDLDVVDRMDDTFCLSLYGSLPVAQTNTVIDTSVDLASTSAATILQFVRST